MALKSKKSHLLQAGIVSLALTAPLATFAESSSSTKTDVVQEEEEDILEEQEGNRATDITPQQKQAEKLSKSGDIWAGFGSQKAVNIVARASETLENVNDKEAYKKAQELAKKEATERIMSTQEDLIKNTYTPPKNTSKSSYFDKGVKPTDKRLSDSENSGSVKDKLAFIFGASLGRTEEDSAYFAKNCSTNFYLGVAPKLTDASGKIVEFSYNLCLNGFAVKYSGLSKTPLWSAEHLTADRLNQASRMQREDSFHEENRIPSIHRATLLEYKNKGYARGYLAASGDMANEQQQFDSFSLVNVAPQTEALNKNLWREVESNVRELVYDNNEAYVVTGTAFTNSRLKQLKKSILVPSAIYKAVYIPSKNEAAVYYAPNDDSLTLEIISLKELEDRIGFDVMPSVSEDIKINAAPFAIPDHLETIPPAPSAKKSGLYETKAKAIAIRAKDIAISALQMTMDFFKNLRRFF